MLKRDFIMVQIEELAKVILQIILNRHTGATRTTPALIQTVYTSLKLDRNTLMNSSPADMIRRLNQEDNGGILRLEIALKALIEESYLETEKQQDMLRKAKEYLLYIQQHDKTFSMERVSLLEEIDRLLAK